MKKIFAPEFTNNACKFFYALSIPIVVFLFGLTFVVALILYLPTLGWSYHLWAKTWSKCGI